MNNLLTFDQERQKALIAQVATKLALPVQAVEKDWWVTIVLEAIFSLPMSKHFIFKGGTSLSKGWKLIERFSEDIDIALSPEAFGKTYEAEPSNRYVKLLKKEGCEYTSTVILKALEKQLSAMGIPAGMLTIEAEEVHPERPDKDPQTLYVKYPSLFEAGGYLLEPIKIEFGVRSLREPFESVHIVSMLKEETDSSAYQETPFTVFAVAPRKTYMEKMMLLHEKYIYGINPDKAKRQSRHLSDLYKMDLRGITEQVIEDQELYEALLKHRSTYVRLKGVNYTEMKIHQLRIIPPDEILEFFKSDYEVMQGEMMYGDVPDFIMLIERLKDISGKIAIAVAKEDNNRPKESDV